MSLGALVSPYTVRRRCCTDASTASRGSYRLWGGRLWNGRLRYDRELDVVVHHRGLRRLTPNSSCDNAGDTKGNEDNQTHCENYLSAPAFLVLLGLSLGAARVAGSVSVKPTVNWSHDESCMCVLKLTGMKEGSVSLCYQLLDRDVCDEEEQASI